MRLIPLAVLLALAGCEIPGQVVWSPDGKRAAYLSTSGEKPGSVAVVDESGKILAKLGSSTGGLAWSKDSKRLYFASVQKAAGAQPQFDIRTNWANAPDALPDLPAAGPATQEAGEGKEEMVVSVWENDAVRPLFRLPDANVWQIQLSGDQKWLAAMAHYGQQDRQQMVLYAFALASRRLYPLCVGDSCKAMCFTQPSRLAFVEPDQVKNGVVSDLGSIVEVELDESVEKLERQNLVKVVPKLVGWIEPAGDDLLFTSMNVTLPMLPTSNGDPPHKLMRHNRPEAKLTVVLDDVGELFKSSPDGRRILVEKVTASPDRSERSSKLVVFDVAGGAVHPVCDLPLTAKVGEETRTGIPAYPAWRGNDQITFVDWTKPPVQQEDRAYFDLVQYQLTDKFELRPLRSLSEKWPVEMKPSFKLNDNH